MTKVEFSKRFRLSIEECIVFTKTLVEDKLSNEYLFNLYINLYKDGKRVEKFLRLNFDETIDKLYRTSGIPKWVNISVAKVDGEHTIIRCDYSADFVTNDHLLQFSEDILTPFNPGGPHFSNIDKLTKIRNGGKVFLEDFDEESGR